MILVTGATGTTGSELVRLLAEAGAPVRALVRLHPSTCPPTWRAGGLAGWCQPDPVSVTP